MLSDLIDRLSYLRQPHTSILKSNYLHAAADEIRHKVM